MSSHTVESTQGLGYSNRAAVTFPYTSNRLEVPSVDIDIDRISCKREPLWVMEGDPSPFCLCSDIVSLQSSQWVSSFTSTNKRKIA
jgi:hypothetical protein